LHLGEFKEELNASTKKAPNKLCEKRYGKKTISKETVTTICALLVAITAFVGERDIVG